jgi:hypothetical protein
LAKRQFAAISTLTGPGKDGMHRRPVMFAPAVAALLLVLAASPALANEYAGWQTGNKAGIKGYISTTDAGTVSSAGDVVFSWINLCAHNDCNQWVQVGVYQGAFLGGSSPYVPHIYYENVDMCGVYYADDLGAPPVSNYFYELKYDGTGAHTYTCPNGVPKTGYRYDYRKGSSGASPFFIGVLSTQDGLALAKTEVQGNPTIPTTRFGCSATSCTATAYGLRLYVSSWSLWTGASTSSQANPPWLHTYSNYWGYKTCPTYVC